MHVHWFSAQGLHLECFDVGCRDEPDTGSGSDHRVSGPTFGIWPHVIGEPGKQSSFEKQHLSP